MNNKAKIIVSVLAVVAFLIGFFVGYDIGYKKNSDMMHQDYFQSEAVAPTGVGRY